jgi:hypothetical protein
MDTIGWWIDVYFAVCGGVVTAGLFYTGAYVVFRLIQGR